MIKKIVFSILIGLCIYSLGVFAFRTLEPKDINDNATNSPMIDYRTLDEYLLSSSNGTIHYLFFYSNQNNDSIYLKDTVLNSLNQTSSTDISQLIEIVDVTSVDEEILYPSLKEKYDMSTYPFFACVHIENDTIVIDSILPYDINSPLKANEIKTWLEENGVYFAS